MSWGCSARVMRTNSLPMKPAPPVMSRRISGVLDAPVETDPGIVVGDPAFVGTGGIVRLGDVVAEDHVAQVERLVSVSHVRGDGHHATGVLTEDETLDPSTGRRLLA